MPAGDAKPASAVMDSELKKTSVRANRLEKKRFELLMAGFESAKRYVAVDMNKSQLDAKRRLKRYKDRQRQIVVARSGNCATDMEQFILKQLSRRSHLQRGTRPHTSPSLVTRPRPVGDGGEGGGGGGGREETRGDEGLQHGPQKAEEDEEDEEEVVELSHYRRSKIDLRPATAWSVMVRASAPTARVLQAREGRLGSPGRQVRYLDDEEIEERCTFYRLLVNSHLRQEREHAQTLNMRVHQFCRKPGHVSGQSAEAPARGVMQRSFPPILQHFITPHLPIDSMRRTKTQ